MLLKSVLLQHGFCFLLISQYPNCINNFFQNGVNLILDHWTSFTFKGSESDVTGELTRTPYPKTYNSLRFIGSRVVFWRYFILKKKCVLFISSKMYHFMYMCLTVCVCVFGLIYISVFLISISIILLGT